MDKQFINSAQMSGWHTCVNYNKYCEHHFMLNILPREVTAKNIGDAIAHLITNYIAADQYGGTVKFYSITRLVFVEELRQRFGHILFTQIKQQPLEGAAVAFWMDVLEGEVEVHCRENEIMLTTSDYSRVYWGGLRSEIQEDADQQTRDVLDDLSSKLCSRHWNVEKHVHRTWFYIDKMERDYTFFTDARKEWFEKEGLNAQTHYITSTGIEGGNCGGALLEMDALAYESEMMEVKYLEAKDKLNKTIEYGVTFERGTLLRFQEACCVFISGTASIDSKGDVVHVGDPTKQTVRALANIEALLKDAGVLLTDVVQAVVYVKNAEDYRAVRKVIDERLPTFPCLYTRAAVCRPNWLVEIECIVLG